MRRVILTRYLIEQQRNHSSVSPELRLSMEVVARACKAISHAVSKGPLAGIGEAVGTKNVQGEAQNRELNSFVMTQERIVIPEDSQEFAINTSNARNWEAPVKRYIDECLAGATGPRKKDFNMRWVASMVADVYRILTRGGVFMYPRDAKHKDGRLRRCTRPTPCHSS